VAAYNRTPHSSTGETPFFLLKGRDALEPTDLRPPMRNRILTDQNNVFAQHWQEAVELAKSKLVIAQARQKKYYDRSVKECSFKQNELVLLKIFHVQTGKFYMRWEGPFMVVDKLSEVNYVIRHQEDNFQIVVHVNRLRKWNGEPNFKNSTELNSENLEKAIPPNVDVNNTSVNDIENTNTNENLVTVDIHNNTSSLNGNESENNGAPHVEQTVAQPEAISVSTESRAEEIRAKESEKEDQPRTTTAEQAADAPPVKRKVGRPRKGQVPPKPTIPQPTHSHALRRSIRLPK
jgi:hypothetical protein